MASFIFSGIPVVVNSESLWAIARAAKNSRTKRLVKTKRVDLFTTRLLS
jgi:hypothetical protein